MCRGRNAGDFEMVEVHVDASIACEQAPVFKALSIDRCIAKAVKALDDMGIRMLSSCCGHGKGEGHIMLCRIKERGA